MKRLRVRNLLGWAMLTATVGCGSPETAPGDESIPVGDGVTAVESALVDPTTPGPYQTDWETYGWYDQYVNLGTGYAKVEFMARIDYPKGPAGRFPLVFFLHGQHGTCYSGSTVSTVWPCPAGTQILPNFLGFKAVAQNLASQGMIVVSISANGINAPNGAPVGDVGNDARKALIEKHIIEWLSMNAGNPSKISEKFIGHIDTGRIAEVGHSRGGFAVIKHASETTLLGIKAVMAIAPSNAGSPIPVTNKAFAVMAGYCDGDLYNLPGFGHVDGARYAVPWDEEPKYTFFLRNGNHNYFNSYWAPTSLGGDLDAGSGDDWLLQNRGTDPHCTGTTRLNFADQQYIGNAYIAAFLRKHLLRDSQFDAILKGDAALPRTLLNGQVYVGYLPATQDRKDINQVTTTGNLSTNTMGGAVTCDGAACSGTATPPTLQGSTCSGNACKQTGATARSGSFGNVLALKLSWTQSSGRLSHAVPAVHQDFSNFATLQFRVSQQPKANAVTGDDPTSFSVQLIDTNNLNVVVDASAYSRALYYPPGAMANKAMVVNTVRIPLSAFAGVSLKRIKSVDFLMVRKPSGTVVVSDLALSDPRAYGYVASYSDAMTYGVQTGTAHKSCDWASSGQVCTMPSTRTIHWCWDDFLPAARRVRIERLITMANYPFGLGGPIAQGTDLGFRFVKHASCNDSNVQLVIDDYACSSSTNSMAGYVCATFPSATAANGLTVVNNTPWPAPGQYYSWGVGAWMRLNLDMADIEAVSGTNGDDLLTHAFYHGISWIVGLGSRTDRTDLMTSSAVLPYKKTGGWTAPEICRANSFHVTSEGQKFALGSYCGWDSP